MHFSQCMTSCIYLFDISQLLIILILSALSNFFGHLMAAEMSCKLTKSCLFTHSAVRQTHYSINLESCFWPPNKRSQYSLSFSSVFWSPPPPGGNVSCWVFLFLLNVPLCWLTAVWCWVGRAQWNNQSLFSFVFEAKKKLMRVTQNRKEEALKMVHGAKWNCRVR